MPESAKIVKLPNAKPKSKPRNMTSDGRRCIRIDVGTDPETGKRIRKAFYGKTLKEAQQKADEYRHMMSDGIDIAARTQTVSQWAQTWLETYGSNVAPSTLAHNKLCIKYINAQIADMPLYKVRSIHIQRIADSVSDKSATLVGSVKSILNRMFETAIGNNMINRNPVIGTVWKGQPEQSHRALSDAEIALIVAHWREHRLGLMVILMLYTGLRMGEACALTWDDVDLDARLIHVNHSMQAAEKSGKLSVAATKNRSSVRAVPILDDLYAILTALPHESEFVVTPHFENITTRQHAIESFNQHMQQYDPSFKIRTHDLRHTFATQCFEANVDIKTAQQILGHATATMTMNVYTHISEERERVSLASLNAVMARHNSSEI